MCWIQPRGLCKFSHGIATISSTSLEDITFAECVYTHLQHVLTLPFILFPVMHVLYLIMLANIFFLFFVNSDSII
jgi:hypothetical protein